jgi:bla regulator protein blaR1
MTLRSRLAARAAIVVSATALSVSRPHAQAPPAQAPDPNAALTYEAASVKPNKSGVQGSSIRRFPGGRLQATNMPLRALITFAYQLQPFQLVEDPAWIRSDTFDIVAKMEGDPPPVMPGTGPDPHMVAMRTLLAERFKLAVHRETRRMDIYELVLARADGKLGPALKPTTQDCAAMMAAARGGPPPGPPPGPNSPVVCGMRGLPGRLVAGAMPMTLLASNLSGQVQRIVVDRTGLSGAWDFEITFAPERPVNPPPGVEFPPADPNAPSLFTAMQEQLGLKLQSTKGPVEVLVVERVEQPLPD